jgi:hypothetical protein
MPGTIELFDGRTTTDPRLDRVPYLDPASRNFTIRQLLEEHARTRAQKRRHIVPGPTLDQRNSGGCTGFSITHGQEATPFRVKLSDETALEWYYDNQQHDGYPGGERAGSSPRRAGSTVIASMKTLVQLGLITEYRWIGAGSGTLMDDLHDTLKYVGPVHFGTNWYASMLSTAPNGLLTVDRDSELAGGHAYCVHDWVLKKLAGTPKRREYVVMQQSWGDEWGGRYHGKPGYAFIPVEDAEALLLEEGGEGAVPLKHLPSA